MSAPSQRKKLHRQQFPAGRDGQQLVLETHSPNGLAWRDLSVKLEPEYLTAHRTWAIAFSTRGITSYSSGQVWFADGDITGSNTNLSTWTSAVSSEWSDSDVSGEFVYSGNTTKKFRVSYHASLWYYLRNQYTSLLGGVFRKPSGGSWPSAPVAGSAQMSNLLYDYTLGVFYVYLKACSGGAIVEVDPGDTLRFQYGFYINSGTNTDGNVWLYAAGAGSDAAGMSLTIDPVT